MRATDRLCALLDEHGIEYISNYGCTNWMQPSGYTAVFDETMDESDTRLTVYAATPEQAIAATVGRGTCHMVLKDDYEVYGEALYVWWECDECGCTLPKSFGMPEIRYCPSCGRLVIA